MKKLFALTLAVVMVLAVASSAMAFSWGKPADDTADNFASRYKIEVVKLANETGIIGTNKLIEAPGATAVNNASVYFYIRLTVTGAKLNPAGDAAADDADDVQKKATASVSFTALNSVAGGALAAPAADISLADFGNGIYYYSINGTTFKKITDFTATTANSDFSAAAIEGRVLDTATAKVYAKVYAKRDLAAPFNCGSYDIFVKGGTVSFYKAANPTPAAEGELNDANLIATFNRDGNSKVTSVTITATANAQDVAALYQWLNAGSADAIYTAIKNGEMYMTDGNIRAAFGFDYKGESSITWNANATAIILDPNIGVGIPKTGDNASVIGFAMVMIAVVGAAVAVKKVRA